MPSLTTRTLFSTFFALTLFISCNNYYRPQSLEYTSYRVNASEEKDPELLSLIKPYGDSVNKSMNQVIGYAEKTLDKKQPESTLGNFMADAMREMASQKFNTRVDAAFVNYGGVRLTQLPQGGVTKGKIYELMPFDNLVILQTIKGNILQQFLDLIAARGGWPVSGLSMQIREKKAVNIMIGNKPLDHAATYIIANSDYVANGGDDAAMLRSIPQQNIGYLYRDAIIEYISILNNQGKKISAVEENRTVNVQ